MNRLMAWEMGLLAGPLLALPHVRSQVHVALYAVVMGLAGGFIITIFFSFWSRTFAGPTSVGYRERLKYPRLWRPQLAR